MSGNTYSQVRADPPSLSPYVQLTCSLPRVPSCYILYICHFPSLESSFTVSELGVAVCSTVWFQSHLNSKHVQSSYCLYYTIWYPFLWKSQCAPLHGLLLSSYTWTQVQYTFTIACRTFSPCQFREVVPKLYWASEARGSLFQAQNPSELATYWIQTGGKSPRNFQAAPEVILCLETTGLIDKKNSDNAMSYLIAKYNT